LYSLTVVVLIVVAVLLFAVKIVPPGVEVPVERLGRFVRMTGPGVHLVVPLVDRFRTPVSTREETLRTPERPFATADGQEQLLVCAVTWRVTDTRAAAYEIGDYRIGVEQLLMTTLRSFVSAHTLADA
uniref:SPFH domain-containing protein n=1 Tax=Lapillicoccus sp. TaxID=1909287 RepID=UPI0025D08EC0